MSGWVLGEVLGGNGDILGDVNNKNPPTGRGGRESKADEIEHFTGVGVTPPHVCVLRNIDPVVDIFDRFGVIHDEADIEVFCACAFDNLQNGFLCIFGVSP